MAKKQGLAQLLRTAIQDSGQGVYALAKRAGVSHVVIYRFLNASRGKPRLSLDTVEGLLDALDLEVRKRNPEKSASTT